MFALLLANWRLIGIGAAVIAVLSLAYVVNSWRDDSKALAVERAQHQEAVAGFEEQLRQIQHQELVTREASRDYQAKLIALQADADSLRESNRGLQITARRRIPEVSIAVTRLADAPPEPERYREYAIDTERLTQFATACQADAEQLAALQGWVNAIAR